MARYIVYCNCIRAAMEEGVRKATYVVWRMFVILLASQVHMEEEVLLGVLSTLTKVGGRGLGGLHSVHLTKHYAMVSY
jgi:hypothetical protein